MRVILLLFLCTGTLWSNAKTPMIVFHLHTEIEIPCDTATIHIFIQREKSSYEQATLEIEQTIKEIKNYSERLKIPKKNILVFDMGNRYARKPGRDAFHQTQLEIKTSRFDLIKKISKKAIDIDRDITLSTSFSVEDKQKIQQELIRRASETSKFKKALYEEAFGIQLKLFHIQDQNWRQHYPSNESLNKREMMFELEQIQVEPKAVADARFFRFEMRSTHQYQIKN